MWSVNSGRRAGAAFLAIDHDEVRGDAGFQHGLGNAHEFPRVAQAELEAHRLAAGQLAQLAMNCIISTGWETRCGDGEMQSSPIRHARVSAISGDLVLGQDAAMAGLGTLADLDLDHLHLRVLRLGGEAFGVEAPVLGAAAEIAAAQFPDQVAAVFAVVGADAAFAGVMGKLPRRALLSARMALALSAPKLMAEILKTDAEYGWVHCGPPMQRETGAGSLSGAGAWSGR
jgi:hypothetical protein